MFLSLSSGTARGVTVEAIRYWSSEAYTRVVIDLSKPARYSQNRLSNPERLYFDIKSAVLSRDVNKILSIEDGILKRIRSRQFNKNTVRVVLDLNEIDRYKVFELNDPFRLVIDVFGKKNVTSIADIEELEEILKIKRVVIDPGHGGEDPGAIGPRGVKEKDIVLSIGKKLGRILKEKYNMEVFYTRQNDIFVPLEKRTAIANAKKADLFISIHVNASPRRKARGVETYFLNWTSNEEAMKVAARENAVSYKKMKKTKGELQMILHDLERDNKKDESMKLAGNVQQAIVSALQKEYPDVIDLGVKYAPFYVLVGADMQSILIETSFISNKKEEKRLSSKKYRTLIAEGIASGINKYIESKQTIVKRTTGDQS
jgi:N-acetylmuramoyl-L-alanine amidase